MKTNRMNAKTIVAKLFDAMTARRAALVADGSHVADEITKRNGLLDNFDPQGSAYNEFVIAVEHVKQIFDFGHLLAHVGKHKKLKANDENYMQCKTVEKIVRFIKAFGHRDFRMLDPHTRVITLNALKNNGVISSKGAFCALTSLEMKDAIGETLIDKRTYSAGTGSTQLSSTRELFRILGLTNGVKGARDAAIDILPEVKETLLQHFTDAAARIGLTVDQLDEIEETEE